MVKLFNYGLLLLRKFLNADIVKVFSLTSVSTLVKMMTGLISVKVVSTLLGASGVALLGQLNSFSSIVLNLATGGINSGVTKYIAEDKENPQKIRQYLSTSLRITLYCSFFVGLFIGKHRRVTGFASRSRYSEYGSDR